MDEKKYIIDLKDNRYSVRFNGEIYFNKGNKIVKIGNVAKTSDNILDLVEVGDLVELKNDTRMVHIHNQRWLDVFLSKVQEPEEDEFKIKDNIKAIYKRQPNGDYKKYEVKA